MKFRHTNFMRLIYATLLALPFVAILSRVIYVQSNKNAYQSAEITQTTYNKVQIDNVLRFNSTNGNDDIVDVSYSEVQFYGKLLSFMIGEQEGLHLDDLYTESMTPSNVYLLYIQNQTNNEVYFNIGDDENYLTIYMEQCNNFSFDFVLDYGDGDYQELITDGFIFNCPVSYYDYEEVESTTLDNVFEYSVNKLAETPILSWTQQTAIYTGVNTMTTQLGVNTPTIPMLIVYWFLLTVIYIIIDIIIKLFTWLTHMIGSKSV